MKLIAYIAITFSFSLASCKKGVMLEGSERVARHTPKGASEPLTPTPSSDALPVKPNPDERVDPPANIVGAALSCAFEVKPSDQSNEALIGCRIDDTLGVRRPGLSLAPTFTYEHILNENLGNMKITSRILSGDNRYDALFLVQGVLNSELASKVNRLAIRANFIDANAKSTLVIDGILANILRNSSALPEPRKFDYPSAIGRIVEDAEAGIVKPLELDALPEDSIEKGARLYSMYCQSCHGLKGLDIERNIRNPSHPSIVASIGTTAAMSTIRGLLSNDETLAIEAYLK